MYTTEYGFYSYHLGADEYQHTNGRLRLRILLRLPNCIILQYEYIGNIYYYAYLHPKNIGRYNNV